MDFFSKLKPKMCGYLQFSLWNSIVLGHIFLSYIVVSRAKISGSVLRKFEFYGPSRDENNVCKVRNEDI